MDKGAYEIIKLLIQNVDQKIELVFVDGRKRTIPVDPDKLLAELDKVQRLEEEADWLATRLEERDIADHYERRIELQEINDKTDWREAARKAISEAGHA